MKAFSCCGWQIQKKRLVKTYFSAPNGHIVKNTKVEKVCNLSYAVENNYVNNFSLFSVISHSFFAVEKPVDNVENSWLSTVIFHYPCICTQENPLFLPAEKLP